METKYCKDCGCEQPIENFYVSKKDIIYRLCKKHSMLKSHRYRFNENDFVNHCPPQPNTYFDERQKEQTFEFLTALGWSFNEPNNTWFKLPVKDSNGNWFIKP